MSSNTTDGAAILVVEDFEDTRLMVKMQLQVRGYRVIEADNGEAAGEVALRERSDLILMDLSLHVFDGLTAIRRIRQHPGMEDVPIIAVTAYEEEHLEAECREAGCTAYIKKPADIDMLVKIMNQFSN